MSTLEQELRDEAAALRKSGGYSPTARMLERAANEIKHLRDIVQAYSDMAKSR